MDILKYLLFVTAVYFLYCGITVFIKKSVKGVPENKYTADSLKKFALIYAVSYTLAGIVNAAAAIINITAGAASLKTVYIALIVLTVVFIILPTVVEKKVLKEKTFDIIDGDKPDDEDISL